MFKMSRAPPWSRSRREHSQPHAASSSSSSSSSSSASAAASASASASSAAASSSSSSSASAAARHAPSQSTSHLDRPAPPRPGVHRSLSVTLPGYSASLRHLHHRSDARRHMDESSTSSGGSHGHGRRGAGASRSSNRRHSSSNLLLGSASFFSSSASTSASASASAAAAAAAAAAATVRSPRLNPPVDLRLLDYVSPYDENLMCPICRCPFVDPVALTDCDHCFCRDCIRQTWTAASPAAGAGSSSGSRGHCPSCRTLAKVSSRSAVSKILTNILDDLVVRCPHTDDGCRAQVKRGEVQDHVNIYCGYAHVECPADTCPFVVRRKDVAQGGCLHYAVSCLSCHENMHMANLETHWHSQCPNRQVLCDLCHRTVFHRELDAHRRDACPAVSVPCPGHALGCPVQSPRAQADAHAQSCVFATLTPVLAAQTQRLNEQETAQKLMSRKLEVLESGFHAMQHIFQHPAPDDPDASSADESRIPFLGDPRQAAAADPDIVMTPADPATFQLPRASTSTASSRPTSFTPEALTAASSRAAAAASPIAASGSGSRSSAPSPLGIQPPASPSDLPEPFSSEFHTPAAAPFPPPAAHGPYVSPFHHLLSMHESLRDEMSRVSSALQELDGRHSMQILNENLRTREEISYIGAQVAGLSRQVHWLTSAQLQQQQQQQQQRPQQQQPHQHQSRTATPSAAAGPSGDMSGAGAGVEAAVSAVSTAASALRGAAKVVHGAQSAGMRRRHSEEGRTKL